MLLSRCFCSKGFSNLVEGIKSKDYYFDDLIASHWEVNISEVIQAMGFHWSIIIISGFSFLLNVPVSIIFVRFGRKLFHGHGVTRQTYYLAINHNVLLFSMMLSNLLSSIFGLVLGMLFKFDQLVYVCRALGSIPLFGLMFVSIFGVGFLTMDRVVAVIRPLRYYILMSKFRVKGMVAILWAVPFLLTVSQVTVHFVSATDSKLQIRMCFLTTVFLLGFTVLLISNISLILKVWKTSVTRWNTCSPKRANSYRLISEAIKLEEVHPLQISLEKKHSYQGILLKFCHLTAN